MCYSVIEVIEMEKYYSVKELRENFVEILIKLGVNEKFKDNPAFSNVIAELDGEISRMNMGTDYENIQVTETDSSISFKYSSVTNSNYTMSIEIQENGNIRCLTTESKTDHLDNTKQMRKKDITEINISIDDQGYITNETHFGHLNDLDCQNYQCNVQSSARKEEYNPEGIMVTSEYKLYNEYKQPFDIDGLPLVGALQKDAFRIGSAADNGYSYKEIISRRMFDTGRLYIDDKRNNQNYSGIVQLSGEYGYRKLGYLLHNYQPQTINPLSNDQIEQEINKDPNEKVRQALRNISHGRDTYYYSSLDDPSFHSSEYDSDQMNSHKSL